jgi:hypothetical protein
VLGEVSGPEQALVGVIVGLVVIGLPLLIRYLVRLGRGQERIMAVLITPEPTPLVPNPPKGLVDVVAGLVKTSKASLAGTAALIKDSKPNDGSTSRDVLDRIEAQTQADDSDE